MQILHKYLIMTCTNTEVKATYIASNVVTSESVMLE